MVLGYWDARTEAARLAGERRWIARLGQFQEPGPPEGYLQGRWEQRNRFNVPGPFYGAITGSRCAGVAQAPGNVLYDHKGHEFVWRQPRSSDDVRNLLNAAYVDPGHGYGWDGDDHWSPVTVHAWWNSRSVIEEWIDRVLDDLVSHDRRLGRNHEIVVNGLRSFGDYLRHDLERDLHEYAYWLEARRPPVAQTA